MEASQALDMPCIHGIGGLRIASIEQSAEDTSLVHLEFCVFSQMVVVPDSLVEFRHGICTFGDAFANFCIEEQVAGDCGM